MFILGARTEEGGKAESGKSQSCIREEIQGKNGKRVVAAKQV
jgi:hypothetical protein